MGSSVNKKDDKEVKPVIKWKKVTDTRDTAIPSDKSEDSESESDDFQETLDESHDTIETSSQDEIREDQLTKKSAKDSKDNSQKNKKRIQTIKLEGPIKKKESS